VFGLFGKLQTMMIAASAAAVFIAGVFLYGVKTQKVRQRVRGLKEFKDTTNEINSVDTELSRDGSIKRLRSNGIIR